MTVTQPTGVPVPAPSPRCSRRRVRRPSPRSRRITARSREGNTCQTVVTGPMASSDVPSNVDRKFESNERTVGVSARAQSIDLPLSLARDASLFSATKRGLEAGKVRGAPRPAAAATHVLRLSKSAMRELIRAFDLKKKKSDRTFFHMTEPPELRLVILYVVHNFLLRITIFFRSS